MASMAPGSGSQAFRLKNLTSEWGTKIWTLTFDLPHEKVNKLNRAVMEEFEGLIPRLEEEAKAGRIDALVLVSAKPGIFIAGADIEMIQASKTAQDAEALSRTGQKLIDRWEDLPFPTVAAIEGAAMGGGCEFSLASTAIVMSNDSSARIGLPEVMLGVIPGMGGCVRMPRKVGLATALDLILTGKTLNADRAYKTGLIEAVLPKENFEHAALLWTQKNFKALREGKRLAREPQLAGMGGPVGTLMEKTPLGRRVILKKAREGVVQKTRGNYPAPLEAIEVIQSTAGAYGPRLRGSEREEAMKREAQGFGKVAATDVSKNLIRLFFLTEGVKKSKGVAGDASVTESRVSHGAVLGAGIMGGGIAQLLAAKNIPVRMKDLNTQALALGVQSAMKLFKKDVQRKKIKFRQMEQKLNLIAPITDFSGFRQVDVVIEAIVENIDIKKKVFAELENHVSDSTIIASNTSSLSITEMQKALAKPERFVGMHFFNPVSKMPLVEVIRGEKTSDQAVSTIFQFSKQLGKTPIVVKDCPGFLVNRLLMPYLNEATWLLAEGVPVEEIDQAMLDFGMPMGPMELIDEVGIDVGEKVAHILHAAYGDRVTPASANEKFTQAGRLGKKNSLGIYKYDASGKNKELDPEIYNLLGVKPVHGKVSAMEIVERCILPMVNEAAMCLAENVVSTADQVDLGMIMGTGFPPFRGGLLRYADTLGPQAIVEKLKKYEKRFGARYQPSSAILTYEGANRMFYS